MLLAIPGLALLAGAGALSGNWMPLFLTSAAFRFAAAAPLAACWRHGRGILPLAALMRLPIYILWQIPIYVGFFTRNQRYEEPKSELQSLMHTSYGGLRLHRTRCQDSVP